MTRTKSVQRANSIDAENKDHCKARSRRNYHVIEMKSCQGLPRIRAIEEKTKSYERLMKR